MKGKGKCSNGKMFLFGFLGALCAIALVLGISVVVYKNIENNSLVNEVKESYLEGYESKSIGEAFEDCFDDMEWHDFEMDGVTYVEMNGKVMYENDIADVQIILKKQNTVEVFSIKVEVEDENVVYSYQEKRRYYINSVLSAIYSE